MRTGPDRRAFVASALVHVVAFALVWWSETVRPEPVEFVAYEIELAEPPSAVEAEAALPEDLEIETPEDPAPEPEPVELPPPPEPEPEDDAPPEEPELEPEPEEPEPEEPTPEEEPEPEPVEETVGTEEPDPEAETAGEDIEVRIEGLRRDYPQYYENIIRQIQRCFRPRGGGRLATTVRFYIQRDGTVSDLSIVERSGSPEFDFEAMGAVECAGTGDRLGPLPEELPYDRLPIEFTFRPSGG